MGIAMRYSRDTSDAADILSHAFVRMFRSLHSFDETKGNLHGWLKTIVIHEALDHIRQRSRFAGEELAEAEEPQVDNSAIERMDANGLLLLIKQLPPATHAVFVLYVIDGYTHQQIAEELKISAGTSKWHLSEARKILQQKLANYQRT